MASQKRLQAALQRINSRHCSTVLNFLTPELYIDRGRLFIMEAGHIFLIELPPTRDVQTNGKTASACSSCEDDKEERVLSDEQYDRSVASTERKTSERVEHQRQRRKRKV